MNLLSSTVRQRFGHISAQYRAVGGLQQAWRSYTSNNGTELTVRDALNQALEEELHRDDKVFILGEEVAQYNGAYKVTRGVTGQIWGQPSGGHTHYEMGFTGLAVGAAFGGLKPICEFMTFNFAMQAIDQIVNSAAKTHYMSGGIVQCPIVFRGPNGSAAGVAAQHSQDYSAWYGSVAGLKVLAPWNAEDAKGLLKAAIRDPNPVVFLENEIEYGASYPMSQEALGADFVLSIGKAKIERTGKDVTIVASSHYVGWSLAASDALAKENGIECEVINLRTIKPMDIGTVVESVKKTNHIITVEGAWASFGVGSEIAARIMESEAFDYLDSPLLRVAGADVPTPYAENLEALAFPDDKIIVKAVRTVLDKRIGST